MLKSVFSNLPTFLAAGDPFQSTNTLANNGVQKVQLIATAIFALVVVVTGLAYSFGGRELKQAIRKKWVDILIAIVAVYGGTMIITFAVSFVQNGGFK